MWRGRQGPLPQGQASPPWKEPRDRTQTPAQLKAKATPWGPPAFAAASPTRQALSRCPEPKLNATHCEEGLRGPKRAWGSHSRVPQGGHTVGPHDPPSWCWERAEGLSRRSGDGRRPRPDTERQRSNPAGGEVHTESRTGKLVQRPAPEAQSLDSSLGKLGRFYIDEWGRLV